MHHVIIKIETKDMVKFYTIFQKLIGDDMIYNIIIRLGSYKPFKVLPVEVDER